ncbi:MAG: response regulator [Bacteroidota bacterium]|jgi:response regulator RpfG family c-di-GMP phosphodiesterase
MDNNIKPLVLYVDDEDNNLNAFRAGYRRDFEIYTASSALEGLKILEQHEIPVLITDQRMPEVLGTELLAEAVQKFPDQMRILLTGFSDIDALKDAVNRGQIYKYMQKPWNHDELKETINMAAQIYQLKKERIEMQEKLLLNNEQLEFILRQKLLS